MAEGNKRAAEDSSEHEAERVSKASKTQKNGESSDGKANTKATKAKLTADEFKERALPLHVALTHTPPTILKEGLIEEDGTVEHVPANQGVNDAGLVGSLTLLPSSFSTGSYGWKGNRRVTVELQAGEVGPDGTREKVQVMLTINATVVGSKPDKKDVKKDQSPVEGDDSAEVEDDAAVE